MEEIFSLTDGSKLLIRPAIPNDAKDIIKFVNLVSTESDNLSMGEGDFDYTEDKERQYLNDLRKSPNSIMIIGIIGDEIVSVSDLHGGGRPRIQHYVELGVSVKKSSWNIGVGRSMMEFLIKWAKNTQIIRKINLQVRISNKWAIHLYEDLGFKIEGIITRGFYINNEFFDLYMMGLEID